MVTKIYRIAYFVRDGKFKGINGSKSLFPEVEEYFKDTIESFGADAEKEQEINPSRNYTGRLKITIEEN